MEVATSIDPLRYISRPVIIRASRDGKEFGYTEYRYSTLASLAWENVGPNIYRTTDPLLSVVLDLGEDCPGGRYIEIIQTEYPAWWDSEDMTANEQYLMSQQWISMLDGDFEYYGSYMSRNTYEFTIYHGIGVLMQISSEGMRFEPVRY